MDLLAILQRTFYLSRYRGTIRVVFTFDATVASQVSDLNLPFHPGRRGKEVGESSLDRRELGINRLHPALPGRAS